MSVKEVPRRFRLRNPLLKDKETAKKLAKNIVAVQGVSHVKVNARVGSLLVLFYPARTTAENILDQVSEKTGINSRKWLTTKQHRPLFQQKRTIRKYVKMGLAASFGGTIGTLAVSGKTHALAGSVFLCFLAVHSYQHRRTLLA